MMGGFFKPGQFKPGRFKPGQFKPGCFKPGVFKPGFFKPFLSHISKIGYISHILAILVIFKPYYHIDHIYGDL